MKTKLSTIGYIGLCFFTAIILNACGREALKGNMTMSETTNIPPKSDVSPQFPENQSAPQIDAAPDTSQPNTIATLSHQINETRKSKDAEAADKLMHELMATWKPEGKSIAELKALLGEPDEKTADTVCYRFDNGYGGWKWNFKTANDVIVKVTREGID